MLTPRALALIFFMASVAGGENVLDHAFIQTGLLSVTVFNDFRHIRFGIQARIHFTFQYLEHTTKGLLVLI